MKIIAFSIVLLCIFEEGAADPPRHRLIGLVKSCQSDSVFTKKDSDGVARFRFCWNTPGYSWQKAQTESDLRDWTNVAMLEFRFEADCRNKGKDTIVINIKDIRPIAYPSCPGNPGNAYLNFEFKAWAPSNVDCKSSAGLKACMKLYTLHEFGHLLGFGHEQDHRDNRGECDQVKSEGGQSITSYDYDSIMHYCAPGMWTNPKLSCLDIQGVQKIYGARGTPKTGCKGSCEDNYSQCGTWSKSGECTKNPIWMTTWCRKSCNKCSGGGGTTGTGTGGVSAGCSDSNSGCAGWAAAGHCSSNPGYMKPNCRKSCRQC